MDYDHSMSALELLTQTLPAPCSQCAIKSAQAYATFMATAWDLSRVTLKAQEDLRRRKSAGKAVERARTQYIVRCTRSASVYVAAHALADAVVVEMDARVAVVESKSQVKIAKAVTARASEDYQAAKSVEIRCYRLAVDLFSDS